ncbi:MAG: hypothetical protein M1817_001885 [Caeruleum heppii]|nr:MAG: hypothetical protein M1817_001885 [Caeruleum heppii]
MAEDNLDMNGFFDLSSAGAHADCTADMSIFDPSFTSPHFTSINDPVAQASGPSQGTVSPKDLVRDSQASAPPSTAFTNLTSPSIFDSPDVTESFETSPMFNNESDIGADSWFSLFPGVAGENGETPPTPAEDVLERAAYMSHVNIDQPRQASGRSPQTGRGASAKHSSVSGVNSRKRDKPLPPIQIDDPNDTIAMKRARNTLAARKSRQKKVEKFEELEEVIDQLRGEVAHWKNLALGRDLG